MNVASLSGIAFIAPMGEEYPLCINPLTQSSHHESVLVS